MCKTTMPEKSSVDSPGVRAAMLLLNVVPLLHAVATLACFLTPWPWLAVVVLYVIPMVPGRVLRESLRRAPAEIEIGSADFLKWWACFQFQVLFLRFPALEEVLRLVPGLYSSWLRCWGSRVGKLTYWAPGTVILDRGFLDIGDRVVFGAGVRLNPHVMENVLKLAPVRIADDAMIGGYSLLTAGTEIASGEATRAFLISPPFSKWQNGTRQRKCP
jgi:hypothetical protein